MLRTNIFSLVFIIVSGFILHAQETPAWDNPYPHWPKKCLQTEIISSLDGEAQKTFYFKPEGDEARPLIVSLHTWSADYTQKDTLSWHCIKNNYNYIHPDFRGPNLRPEATGSRFVIQDIEDAISWAIQNMNVDTSQIHVIGVSGGGYATILCYMNTHHPVKTFSAWVPVTDIEDLYYVCQGRRNKYAGDIINSVNKDYHPGLGDSEINVEECRSRSPMFMSTPVERRKNAKLTIYAGIHDGYTGTVPISQTLRMYNKIVRDTDPQAIGSIVPDSVIIALLGRRNSVSGVKEKIGGRDIHYDNNYGNRVRVVIFEGGHEMLTDIALDHVPSSKILCIGDSNGALKYGWVNQLKSLRFGDFIYNTSRSGNTIGFDNGKSQKLNTLRNIDSYLSDGVKALSGIDKIVIMLGTNDCKADFNDSLKLVPKNLTKLIKMIKSNPAFLKYNPEIYIVSPPPYGKDENMKEKYHGGSERIAWLYSRFEKIANKEGCIFIDVYHGLLPVWDELAKDGIHPSAKGQKQIAITINDIIY